MQKAAFSLFPSLVPLQPPELWPELLDSLIQLLKPHLLEGQQHQQLQQQLQQQLKQQQQQRQGSFNARGPAAPSSNNNSLHRPALSSLSMERALEILLQLYKYVVSMHALGFLLGELLFRVVVQYCWGSVKSLCVCVFLLKLGEFVWLCHRACLGDCTLLFVQRVTTADSCTATTMLHRF